MTPKPTRILDRCPRCNAVLLKRAAVPTADPCPFCIPIADTEKTMAAVEALQPPPKSAGRGP